MEEKEIVEINLYKKAILVVSILLFLISLTQTAFILDYKKSTAIPSIQVFLLGWMDIFDSIHSPWLANPLLIISWIMLFKKTTTALISSFFACCLAFSFLSVTKEITTSDTISGYIISFGSGYWIWLSSSTIFFIFILGIFLLEKRNEKAGSI